MMLKVMKELSLCDIWTDRKCQSLRGGYSWSILKSSWYNGTDEKSLSFVLEMMENLFTVLKLTEDKSLFWDGWKI